jgi:hypothetical protein
VRLSVQLALRIAYEAKQKFLADAGASGYKTLRAYAEALIEAGLPKGWKGRPGQFPAVVPAIVPMQIGATILHSIQAVTDRIDEGEAVGTLLPVMQQIADSVHSFLLEQRRAYDADVAAHERRIAL